MKWSKVNKTKKTRNYPWNIKEVFETCNYKAANQKLHDGWKLLQVLNNSNRCNYVLARY